MLEQCRRDENMNSRIISNKTSKNITQDLITQRFINKNKDNFIDNKKIVMDNELVEMIFSIFNISKLSRPRQLD